MTGPVEWNISPDATPPTASARVVLPEMELFVPLAGWIDIESEKTRLRSEMAAAEADLAPSEAKLANEQFLSRAPEDVVEKERQKAAEFRRKRDRLTANLRSLGE
jgi:valyl-tRNA synthetase